jgi:O-antigen ligase
MVIISLTIIFFYYNQIDYYRERFSTNFINDVISSENSNFSLEDVEPRVKRWASALELVNKSPIIGYGTGDEILMLKSTYFEKEYYISYKEGFNAHNQYLSYIIKNGFIGLIIFLFSFIYFLFLSIKQKDFIYLSLLIILVIGFLTENILDANKGILFFAFFNTFFAYNCLHKTQCLKTESLVSPASLYML